MRKKDEIQPEQHEPIPEKLSNNARRDALRAIAKFTAVTGPGIVTLLAAEQAVASNFHDDPECGKEPVC